MPIFQPPQSLIDFFNLGMFRYVPKFQHKVNVETVINIGAGIKHIDGAMSLDLPEWDADTMAIPFGDDMVDIIYALHFLEHVKEPIKLLRECERVLRPGGVINVVVPYYRSQIAHVDLDHKHYFTERTFNNLFKNDYYEKNHQNWRLAVGLQLIMGLEERNICLFAQITKD